MNFSTNQVRQFYVLSTAADVKDLPNNKRQIALNLNDKGEAKTVSEVIDLTKVTHVEHTRSSYLQVHNTIGVVTLAEGVTPEVGKTYTFKIYIHDLYGAGDEYIQPIVASVEAKTNNALDLYKEIVKSLDPKAEVNTEGAEGKIKGYPLNIACQKDQGIAVMTNLEEANEGWTNAINPIKEVKFDICVDTEVWAKPFYGKGNKAFASGYKLAELEYFCMGERGDQYRMMGYPNHIVTEYNIVPTNEYDVIDIMYYYTDNKEGVQRSEKVMTLAVPSANAEAVFNKFILTTKDENEDENA